jgi:hypothetical protein
MKNIFTSAALVIAACTLSQAQETEFKPVKGANNLELNFIPLNSKPIQITNIRYRKFIGDKTAFRLGFGLSYSSDKADSVFASNMTANSTVKSKYSNNKLGFNIRPGIEKHFEGTNRLSPYMGAELDIALQSSKEVTPTGINAKDEFFVVTEKNKNKGGFFRMGVNLVAGFDCYVTKHLYMGSELGFGLGYTKYSDYKKTTAYPSSQTVPSPDPGSPDPSTQGSSINIGPNFNSSIRLGYIF